MVKWPTSKKTAVGSLRLICLTKWTPDTACSRIETDNIDLWGQNELRCLTAWLWN